MYREKRDSQARNASQARHSRLRVGRGIGPCKHLALAFRSLQPSSSRCHRISATQSLAVLWHGHIGRPRGVCHRETVIGTMKRRFAFTARIRALRTPRARLQLSRALCCSNMRTSKPFGCAHASLPPRISGLMKTQSSEHPNPAAVLPVLPFYRLTAARGVAECPSL